MYLESCYLHSTIDWNQSAACIATLRQRLHVGAETCHTCTFTFPSLHRSAKVPSFFSAGQQAQVRPAAGEGVQGEDQPVLHVRCAREEDPRVQAAAAQLPAHHRHVQPYVTRHPPWPRARRLHSRSRCQAIWRGVISWKCFPRYECREIASRADRQEAVSLNTGNNLHQTHFSIILSVGPSSLALFMSGLSCASAMSEKRHI